MTWITKKEFIWALKTDYALIDLLIVIFVIICILIWKLF